MPEKIFRFAITPNQQHLCGRPTSSEGRIAIVTDVGWDAVDAGLLRQTSAATADGEVVWFWRSEAGAKSAMMLTRLAGDGGNQAMVTEESPKETVNPLRREGRMIPAPPVVLPRAFFLHADRGCELAPGLPCALCLSGGTRLPHNLGVVAPRERDGASTSRFALKSLFDIQI